MVSLARYVRQIRRAGLKEYFRQMMYIGDAKAGTLVGKDQYVLVLKRYYYGVTREGGARDGMFLDLDISSCGAYGMLICGV